MFAIPSVDLRERGAVGHSVGSAATSAGRPRGSPASGAARSLADLGFARLHLIDRESVSHSGINVPSVEDIVRDTDARVQVADVSSTTEIEDLLRAGVDHVVVGARGIEEPDWLATVAELYPGSVAVATNVRDRRVVRRGWVRTLPVDILDLVDELNELPLRELLLSVRSLDNAMRFGDLALLEDVAERSRCAVTVVGDVASVHDLRALEHRGIAGAVIDGAKLLSDVLDGREVAQEFGG
jgi:phosphoribosylformimino-5-aminoimidazole carboxamide ribotide isomerase